MRAVQYLDMNPLQSRSIITSIVRSNRRIGIFVEIYVLVHIHPPSEIVQMSNGRWFGFGLFCTPKSVRYPRIRIDFSCHLSESSIYLGWQMTILVRFDVFGIGNYVGFVVCIDCSAVCAIQTKAHRERNTDALCHSRVHTYLHTWICTIPSKIPYIILNIYINTYVWGVYVYNKRGVR